ncbi:Uncharacterised protein [Segatella copri]|nr:Uncharacterised protein [Segatella copri]
MVPGKTLSRLSVRHGALSSTRISLAHTSDSVA